MLLPNPECEGTMLALDAMEPDQGCGAGAKLWAELDRLIGVKREFSRRKGGSGRGKWLSSVTRETLAGESGRGSVYALGGGIFWRER